MTDSDETDDQRRKRGLPPAPRLSGQPRKPVDPPTPVAWSFYLWIVAGVGLIAGFGLVLTAKQGVIDTLIETNNDQRITNEQIASGVTSLLWVLFIGGVVFAVLFGLFAYKAREGTRSARTILTVLGAVMLLFQLLLFSNLITLGAAFVAMVALVLMYLPSVQDYFPKVPKTLS
ncbi:hypothetical protein BAY61_02015 [Prauserella marina]|uniref:Uncharacterized protein n=1 Tax=Prauserella marina TaxID=530584 RepID=A0A222VJ70_9PSEU|nr:hypothetical protein [Prauserella marina]ASR33968.1 hypothetical protein BAY61_02015 [Prauserella marina]PWV82579.1 hypothetical protein DES30_102822 [Prauserella marina]SDC72424.1 hypothetical protein SAMN05421630_103358 [Prauserella marina]